MATKKKKKSNPGQESYNAQVQQINASYDALINEQKQYNTEFTAGNKVEGLVSGRTRYAPVIQNANIQNVVNTGLGKVQKLVNEKNSLLANAKAAKDKYDAEMLDKELKAAQDAQDAAAKEAQQALENAYKEKDESRKQATFEKTQSESIAENLAPVLSGLLTGNKEEDDQIIYDAAKEKGVDPFLLTKYISKFSLDKQKSQPSSVQEYEYAKSNGYKGSYTQFKKLGQTVAQPKTLTLNDLKQYNLPTSMYGLPVDEVIPSLNSKVPPKWFIDLVEEEYQQTIADVSQVTPIWEEYRKTVTADIESAGDDGSLY